MKFDKSKALFEEAKKYIPGGVNSPVRAFKEIGIDPPFMVKADGSKIYDEDNNEYIDFVSSWGPLILGHNNKQVNDALKKQIDIATSFGAPTALEVEVAKLITKLIPSIEMVRMVNSGTEATMSAIRLARGYTGRDKIVKFAGNYHGHADSFLIHAGSGALTHGVPSSPGIPADVIKHTLIADYNNISSIEDIFKTYGNEIAAVIMEPVSGNMGVVPAVKEFIDTIYKLTREYGSLFIFDEVMTGFRVALGGAQSLYEIIPDLTCFGKIIGGGLPVGAYGGKREIMEKISPVGSVYQAGTLSGNPIAMSAGLTTLKILADNPEIYQNLEEKGKKLQKGFEQNIKELNIDATINRIGSMMTLFFSKNPVYNYASAKKCDTKAYAKYLKAMLEQGIYLPPSQFEAFFISYAHTDEDIDKTVEANKKALSSLKF